MREVMYDINSLVIAGIMFVTMIGALEIGFRIGLRSQTRASEPAKVHINAIQASLLGVLALLLGFTFSLSLQRFDNRSDAVVAEANTIGTAFLRAQLLTPSVQQDTINLIAAYLDLRLQAGAVSLDDDLEREMLLRKANDAFDGLWELAKQAAAADNSPVTTGLFIQSLNEMIDAYSTRNAALDRHVPEVVLFILYGTFLMTSIIVGYAAGVAGHRASFISYIMIALIILLVFVIIDLDRPRRGLIEVDQSSLMQLQQSIKASSRVSAH